MKTGELVKWQKTACFWSCVPSMWPQIPVLRLRGYIVNIRVINMSFDTLETLKNTFICLCSIAVTKLATITTHFSRHIGANFNGCALIGYCGIKKCCQKFEPELKVICMEFRNSSPFSTSDMINRVRIFTEIPPRILTANSRYYAYGSFVDL